MWLGEDRIGHAGVGGVGGLDFVADAVEFGLRSRNVIETLVDRFLTSSLHAWKWVLPGLRRFVDVLGDRRRRHTERQDAGQGGDASFGNRGFMVFSWFEGSVEEASARGLGRGIGGSPVSPQATARRAMATPAALSAYRGLVGRGRIG
jgi:hypothetical protein